MATLTQTIPNRTMNRPGVMLWLAAVAVFSTLLAPLTAAIINNPIPSQDVAIMDWVTGRHWPGSGTFFETLSFLTSSKAGVIYVPAGITFLLLLGKTRAALVFAVVGATVVFVAVLGDYTLGEGHPGLAAATRLGRGSPVAAA